MDDPHDLRDQAQRWRQLARFHDDMTARALREAARALELKAEHLEVARATDERRQRRGAETRRSA